jgi:hypothetical protein
VAFICRSDGAMMERVRPIERMTEDHAAAAWFVPCDAIGRKTTRKRAKDCWAIEEMVRASGADWAGWASSLPLSSDFWE